MNTRLLRPRLLATLAASAILSFAVIAEAGHGVAPKVSADRSTSTSSRTRTDGSKWVYRILATNDLGMH